VAFWCLTVVLGRKWLHPQLVYWKVELPSKDLEGCFESLLVFGWSSMSLGLVWSVGQGRDLGLVFVESLA
jgi:hypothetical protein